MVRITGERIAPDERGAISGAVVIMGRQIAFRSVIIPPEEVANNAKRVTSIDHIGVIPDAIWLIGCFGSDVAQEIADKTKLPVVSTNGVAWARESKDNHDIVVFAVDPKPDQMRWEMFAQIRDKETDLKKIGQAEYESGWIINLPK